MPTYHKFSVVKTHRKQDVLKPWGFKSKTASHLSLPRLRGVAVVVPAAESQCCQDARAFTAFSGSGPYQVMRAAFRVEEFRLLCHDESNSFSLLLPFIFSRHVLVFLGALPLFYQKNIPKLTCLSLYPLYLNCFPVSILERK